MSQSQTYACKPFEKSAVRQNIWLAFFPAGYCAGVNKGNRKLKNMLVDDVMLMMMVIIIMEMVRKLYAN